MKSSRVFTVNEQPGAIEVVENDWASASSGAIITREASTCALVAVHNREKQTGYLGHFSTVGLKNNPAFINFRVNLIASERQEHLSAWIGGITRLSAETDNLDVISTYHEEVNHDKTELVKALGSLTSHLELDWKWLDLDQHIPVAQLDVTTGNFEFVVEQLPR